MEEFYLNDRKKAVLNQIINSYLNEGLPVGSKTLSTKSEENVSSSSLRSVMAELETLGLIYSPHVSSGRLPTEKGLRLYVDNLLGIQTKFNDNEDNLIEELHLAGQRGPKELLSEVSASLSGMTSHAGIVTIPKSENNIRHIEFVRISEQRALVVLVDNSGDVENRLIDIEEGTPDMVFETAGNYLNSKIKDQNIQQLRLKIDKEIKNHKNKIDTLAASLINRGLAVWANDQPDSSLIVRGHDKLLKDIHALDDLEKIKSLFNTLGNQELSIKLLEDVSNASGVKIFIGSENRLFVGTGCSLIIAPFQSHENKVIGALGVIGPKRMNYSKIIPIVDYTSQVVSKILNGENI
ncbi:MAG: heat-inducible transcriptional repressor HrcA [SAR116 cluster bacterium]|nr:heat-inducible transcriptional repressor HrcA [SAR116 cluster bacterium]